MAQNYAQSQATNPKRKPAHLSVSLRHAGPGSDSCEPQKAHDASQCSPTPVLSGPSNDSGDLEPGEAPAWFQRSNENPGAGNTIDQAMMDGDPPFFLKRHSSSTSNQAAEPERYPLDHGDNSRFRPGLLRAATNDSSADDFRSVIDDLTIENKKLRARLRKLEAAHGSTIEGNKLFEVKVHGLSADKRRELEEKLQSFAASIRSPATTDSAAPQGSEQRHYRTLGHSSAHASSSTSNSRRVDSAYASMSTAEAGSSLFNNANKALAPSQRSKQRHIQSFLHEIPEGLLPRHSPVLTEKAKQKLVVKRLEQLFTGRHSPDASRHCLSLQQQEISQSAAQADREARVGFGKTFPSEGVREAHILPPEMDVDKITKKDPHTGTGVQSAEDTSSESLDGLEQRPTRPLDLDPDRTQIPAENISYIRHLGLSTPQAHILLDSQDTAADAEGWVYLNLLINMAQLHIINVTPDFVRSAISNLSSKFQLSPDGRKIRWRGGTDGTQLSSESGADSGPHESPNDSDDFDGHSGKRQKVCISPREEIARDHARQSARSSIMPHQVANERESQFYYQPLFKHHRSSQGSTSNEGSISPLSHGGDSRAGKASSSNRHGQTSHFGSSGKKRRRVAAAPMIFYGGAPFYVDLSGDWSDGSPQPHSADMVEGHNDDICAVGCKGSVPTRPVQPRTTSGSNLAFRPLEDYSKYVEVSGNALQPKTPDRISEENVVDVNFSPQWSSDSPVQGASILDLDATGLGGTRPADHFAVTVKTRRPKLDGRSLTAMSKFSAPGRKTRKFHHRVSTSSLHAFGTVDGDDTSEPRASRLAVLDSGSSRSSSRSASPDDRLSPADLPVKTEVVAMQTHRLQPSKLPPPSSYFPPFSDSEDSDDFEDASSSSFIESRIAPYRLQQQPTEKFGAHMSTPKVRDKQRGMSIDNEQDNGKHEGMEDEMKISHRPNQYEHIDPVMIMTQERELEQEAQRRIADELPIGSSAATVGGGSVLSRDMDYDAGFPA